MENWRKLSENYHQILLNKSSDSKEVVMSYVNNEIKDHPACVHSLIRDFSIALYMPFFSARINDIFLRPKIKFCLFAKPTYPPKSSLTKICFDHLGQHFFFLNGKFTMITLNSRTKRPEKSADPDQRVYTVCLSTCKFWVHHVWEK